MEDLTMDKDGHSELFEGASAPLQVPRQPTEIQNESTVELRLQKIEQYQRESLANPDVGQANLAAANAGLMRVGLQLEEAVIALLSKHDKSLEWLKPIQPTIELQLKVSRQIDRFSRLSHDLRNGANRN
jgi:hypothetical protein